MTARAIPAHRLLFGFTDPRRLLRRGLIWLVVTLLVAFVAATFSHLALPEPSGPHTVGRQSQVWTDTTRFELHTAITSDHRSVPTKVWYPATPDTGSVGPYVPDLDAIADDLAASGELSAIEISALSWVRHNSRDDAMPLLSEERYPVVVLSPGNLTNVSFYASIAEELASSGYVVIGVDHPYQVAATRLNDGSVAKYDASWDTLGASPGVPEKIAERVADIQFVLDRLYSDPGFLGGVLDLDRVAVIGHSNGGLAALEVCRQEPAVDACANLDGQGGGGPFSTDPAGTAPEQPYLFLTKETELHPVMATRFEAGGAGGYRIVVPSASHDHFTDGPLFAPGINPVERQTDHIVDAVRGFVLGFLDIEVKGVASKAIGDIDAGVDAYVNVYPLGNQPPIPVAN